MWFWQRSKQKRHHKADYNLSRTRAEARKDAAAGERRRQMYERIARGGALADAESDACRRWCGD